MFANVTYILNPSAVSNVNFYLPILLALALSPFIIWLLIIFLVKSPKKRFFLNLLTLLYTAFLISSLLPAFLGYSLTQIYQLINLISDPAMALQLFYLEYELTTVYTVATTFGIFYYMIGALVLIADAALLWKSQ